MTNGPIWSENRLPRLSFGQRAFQSAKNAQHILPDPLRLATPGPSDWVCLAQSPRAKRRPDAVVGLVGAPPACSQVTLARTPPNAPVLSRATRLCDVRSTRSVIRSFPDIRVSLSYTIHSDSRQERRSVGLRLKQVGWRAINKVFETEPQSTCRTLRCDTARC